MKTATNDAEWLDHSTYPFRSRFVQLAAGRVHYVDEGEGPVILFVHGTPTWSFEYRHLISGLRSSHRCVAIDHLGFGLSERPDSFDYTPESHAKNLVEFVHALGLRDVTLVVHDFGGPIALPLVLDEPGLVRRVVVMNSWMWSFEGDARMTRTARMAGSFVGRFLYRWLNASLRIIAPGAWGDRRKLTHAIQSQYLAPFRDRDARVRVLWALARALLGSSQFYASLWNRRAELASTETLVVWGTRDPAFDTSFLERWEKTLPRAKVVRATKSGHWPHEEEPELVLGALRAFVA